MLYIRIYLDVYLRSVSDLSINSRSESRSKSLNSQLHQNTRFVGFLKERKNTLNCVISLNFDPSLPGEQFRKLQIKIC